MSLTAEVVIDETIVSGLVEMGFPVEGCRKAVYHTKNAGLEPAMNWVMEHMGDPGRPPPQRPSTEICFDFDWSWNKHSAFYS